MMSKRLFLIAAAVVSTLGIKAQMVDVTAQYIRNAGFEECEALPVVVYHDNQKNVDVNKTELWSHWNTAKGTDYESAGWKLVEQMKNANGGVVTYGINIQSGQYATAGEPGPAEGITGTKGLCFTGAAGLVYRQTEEITLPAGTYRLTVNLYARNGQTTNPGLTQQVNNDKTGFMPTGGTEDDLIPAQRKSLQFASNAWDQEIIDIELTQATKGRFQISYGSSYFVVVDDVKLEYQGGVVTSALLNVIEKATLLNAQLNDGTLTTAIASAQDFVANPTTQEEVVAQVNTLYAAMSTALLATAKAVNLTDIYLENGSFETGKVAPWTWGSASGVVGEPTNSESLPFIDGKKILEFTSSGSNAVTQTVSHLPAGYYAMDAKLNGKAFLTVGGSSKLMQGGSDILYLRVHPQVYEAKSAGDLTVKINASVAFRLDDVRLFYAQDEASLQAVMLADVKADAQALLSMKDYDIVTGNERSTLEAALKADDADAINGAANVFVTGKEDYEKYAKAAKSAEAYTPEAYPYGSQDIYDAIQAIIGSELTSADDAKDKASRLTQLCLDYSVSNAYCEGVKGAVNYTEKIVAGNATGTNVATAWKKLNMDIRTDKTAWNDPKTNTADKNVYGVTADYYRAANGKTAYMAQTLSGLPAGQYVLSVTYMASDAVRPEVQVNGTKVGELVGVGVYGGGVYGGGWVENVIPFTKDDGEDMELRVTYTGTANYQDFYFDNLRLFKVDGSATCIEHMETGVQSGQWYDLQGRRVLQPGKGIYIINNRKVKR